MTALGIGESQPPSGGCVLKPCCFLSIIETIVQPPSGGCVLKPNTAYTLLEYEVQPPSGGCVLKLGEIRGDEAFMFSRLRAAVC